MIGWQHATGWHKHQRSATTDGWGSGIGYRRWGYLHFLWWRASGANTGFRSDCRTHGNAHADTDAGSDADTRANRYADADCCTGTNCDTGANYYAVFYGYANADCHTYGYSNTDCHTYGCTHTNCDA